MPTAGGGYGFAKMPVIRPAAFDQALLMRAPSGLGGVVQLLIEIVGDGIAPALRFVQRDDAA